MKLEINNTLNILIMPIRLNNNVISEIDKLYRYTDSRVDKVINELERIKRTYIKEY